MTESVLALHDGVDGAEPRLLPKERFALGGERWIVEAYQSLPIPPWISQRPYLK